MGLDSSGKGSPGTGQPVTAGGEAPATIFVSYSRVDQKRAKPLIEALERSGFRVWWDGLLEGGETFLPTTEAALESANAVVVLWSKTSVASHWVLDEATRGRERSCLIPLGLDGADPPLGFRQFQVIPFSDWRGDINAPEMQMVLRAATTLAGQAPVAPVRATRAPSIDRRVLIGGGAAAAVAVGGFLWWPRAPANSVAVLPFSNIGDDDSKNYFAEGLCAEVRAALARNPLLRVMAQTSSEAFRRSGEGGIGIARKLGVAFLLDGNVRLSGNTVRIAAELIDGSTGFNRWAQSFERPLDDIFKVQSEIADAVAAALTTQVAAANAKPPSGGTTNVAAFDQYLRGRDLYNTAEDEEEEREALAHFDQAIVLDPKFAGAYAGRSRSLTVIAGQYGDAEQVRMSISAAVSAARRAVALAPDMADAHSTLAFVLFQGMLDIKGARAPFDQSRRLGAGEAPVGGRFASYCAATGRDGEAREAIAKAITLDPLNALMHRGAGSVEYAARRHEKAIVNFLEALRINPKLSNTRARIGMALLALGRNREALAACREETHVFSRLACEAIARKRIGDTRGAQTALEALIADKSAVADYQQAQIHAQWGDVAAAEAALEQAWAHRDAGLIYLRTDPMLDPVRRSPAFSRLLTRLGFD